jgi:hypothetical protein
MRDYWVGRHAGGNDEPVHAGRAAGACPSSYHVILAHQHGVADMSEQRSSEWLSIETMRPPSETEVWLYAKIDGAEITKKGRISKTHPSEPTVYQQWDDIRGPPTHWKPILTTR